MKPTQYIIIVVLMSAGTLACGLSQTSTTVFYAATPVQAAHNDATNLTLLTRNEPAIEKFIQPTSISEIETAILPRVQTGAATPRVKATSSQDVKKEVVKKSVRTATTTTPVKSKIFSVPFISQLTDITDPQWKKVGCGIASLAMIVDYYAPKSVTVNKLLDEGITAGAYSDAGWSYAGLLSVAKDHGMSGQAFDLGGQNIETAFSSFSKAVAKGPVMASVHYKFEPTNPIPHLVVITGIKDNLVYYNDPASTVGNRSISLNTFKAAWKKRYLEFTPVS